MVKRLLLDFFMDPLTGSLIYSVLLPGLIYAVLALDHIAVGQFMVSRPLVVGTVMGWYFGNTSLGFLAGAVAELLWVHVIPVGIWPIDSSVVAALSVAWSLSSPKPSRAVVVLAMLLAIPAGILLRRVDIWFRRQNTRFIPWVSAELEKGNESVLNRAMGLSLFFWFFKAFFFFVAFFVAGHVVLDIVLPLCSGRILVAFDFAGRVLPVVGFCVVLNYFFDRNRLNTMWPDKPSNP